MKYGRGFPAVRRTPLWNFFMSICMNRPSTRACSLGIAAVACLLAAPAFAGRVNYEMVPVGDPGNASSSSGYGAVNYSYQIGKYEVTIGQFTAFLNAVAKDDPYHIYYNPNWAVSGPLVGIAQSGEAGSYSYSAMTPVGVNPAGANSPENRPIGEITWFQAARFANWMTNGQGTGDTETGAYTLIDFQRQGLAPEKNPGAKFYIPTEDEWYKAAYYKGGGLDSGYWLFPTRSDSTPGNTIGGSNDVNTTELRDRVKYFAVTQSSDNNWNQNYLTDVGAFTGSYGPYGTFDQGGNLAEWNDLSGAASGTRGVSGTYWDQVTFGTGNWIRWNDLPAGAQAFCLGFRLAGPAAAPVPEIAPSSFGSAFVLLIGGLGWVERRTRRAVGPRTAA